MDSLTDLLKFLGRHPGRIWLCLLATISSLIFRPLYCIKMVLSAAGAQLRTGDALATLADIAATSLWQGANANVACAREKPGKKGLANPWSRKKITNNTHAGRGWKSNGECQLTALTEPLN
jgi:hypothetical protein